MGGFSAAQWRGLIVAETQRLRETPGGAPPADILEAMIDIESGGDPNAVGPHTDGGSSIGLGQITPGYYEWGAAIQDPAFTARFGANPDLRDPQTNIAIMAIGLDARQEAGLRELQAGRPGAFADWYMASASYLGGATQSALDTDPGGDYHGTTGSMYIRRIRRYILDKVTAASGRPEVAAEVAQAYDDLGPGSARLPPGSTWQDNPATAPALIWDPSVPATRDPLADPVDGWDLPDLNPIDNVTDAIGGGLDRLAGGALELVKRAGLFIAGALLLFVGVRMIAR